LTIGIPGFFLALARTHSVSPSLPRGCVRDPGRRRGRNRDLVAYKVTLGNDDSTTSIDESRTVAVIVLFIVAMWVLGILARPFSLAGHTRRIDGRRLLPRIGHPWTAQLLRAPVAQLERLVGRRRGGHRVVLEVGAAGWVDRNTLTTSTWPR
jgi:hypothetical protein